MVELLLKETGKAGEFFYFVTGIPQGSAGEFRKKERK